MPDADTVPNVNGVAVSRYDDLYGLVRNSQDRVASAQLRLPVRHDVRYDVTYSDSYPIYTCRNKLDGPLAWLAEQLVRQASDGKRYLGFPSEDTKGLYATYKEAVDSWIAAAKEHGKE